MRNSVSLKDRKLYMDFLRIIAAFLVIVNHIYNPMVYFTTVSKSWYASVVFLFISKIAVPIFLMISGSLLLNKSDDKKKYFSRIIKWLCIIFVFSTLYYFYYHRSWDFGAYIHCLLGSATFAYWYLYLYLAILVMLPILQKIAKVLSKEELKLFLLISIFVSGILPFFSIFTTINIENELIEVLFSPYLGMLFAGYYVDKYMDINKKTVIGAGCIFCSLIAVQVILTRMLFTIDNQNYMQLDNRILVTISMSAICVYIIVKYLFENIVINALLRKTITYLGSLTLGIFLFGDMFINLLMPVFNLHYIDMNVFVRLFLLSITVFICSSLCVGILKHIPGIKKIL